METSQTTSIQLQARGDILCIPVVWSNDAVAFEVDPQFRNLISVKDEVALLGEGRLIVGRTQGLLFTHPEHVDVQITGVTRKKKEVKAVLRYPRRQLPPIYRHTLDIYTGLFGTMSLDYGIKLPGMPHSFGHCGPSPINVLSRVSICLPPEC